MDENLVRPEEDYRNPIWMVHDSLDGAVLVCHCLRKTLRVRLAQYLTPGVLGGVGVIRDWGTRSSHRLPGSTYSQVTLKICDHPPYPLASYQTNTYKSSWLLHSTSR